MSMINEIVNKLPNSLAVRLIKILTRLENNSSKGITKEQMDAAIEAALVPVNLAIAARKKKSEILFGSISLDFPNIPAGTTSNAIQGTVAGAVASDIVLVGYSSNANGSMYVKATVTGSGTNNVSFRASNDGLTDFDPTNGTYKYVVFKVQEA